MTARADLNRYGMVYRMERVNRILQHPGFLECVRRNQETEKGRRFCTHGWDHLLDVARLAWIIALEERIEEEKEIVYAAALLHDCGRYRQYEDGTPHEEAGAQIAPGILAECGFSPEERERIKDAILSHRSASAAAEGGLRGLLYRADKRSRSCFACPVREECSWPEEKKNRKLLW